MLPIPFARLELWAVLTSNWWKEGILSWVTLRHVDIISIIRGVPCYCRRGRAPTLWTNQKIFFKPLFSSALPLESKKKLANNFFADLIYCSLRSTVTSGSRTFNLLEPVWVPVPESFQCISQLLLSHNIKLFSNMKIDISPGKRFFYGDSVALSLLSLL